MKKNIVVVKHVETEGPGSIADYFRNTAFDLKTGELSQGESLPSDLSAVAAVIVMGGPMNVYEEEKYPFLKKENDFIGEVVKREIPYLGICLGSQLLAKACGGKVEKAPQKEIGWSVVELTEAAKDDQLFRVFTDKLDVFQWHEDTFTIPDTGVLLAGSEVCPNQAFRYGRNAYGLQFHIEVTPEVIWNWVKADESLVNPIGMLMDSYKKKDLYEQQAHIIYNNFKALLPA